MRHSREKNIGLSTASLLTGLAIFFFAHGWVRNYGGDLMVVIFLYSLLSLLCRQFISPSTRLFFVLLVSCSIEIFQLFPVRETWLPLQRFFIGTTFDPLDIVAYLVGALLIVAFEKAWHAKG